MTSWLNIDETRLISEARATVVNQTEKNQFDPVPYEHATLLLESLPPTQFVDDRVQLALDITVATRSDYRPDLSRRALYAAFPEGSELKDKYVERKWLTFISIIEGTFGEVERSLKHKLRALELCEQLEDSLGLACEWSGLALSASGAGLHEDAVRYATVALEINPEPEPQSLKVRSTVLLNRANALMRLARYAEAECDISDALMNITYPPDASVREQIIRAQFMFAEVRVECGDLPSAHTALSAAATWAQGCGVLKYTLQIEQVRARLSAFHLGVGQGVSKLEALLQQALALEAEFGGSAYDDVVVDVLHTLERVHREHGDCDGANKWVNVIGERLRANAVKMLDALVDKPLLTKNPVVKIAEIDRYLRSKATAQREFLGTTVPSWTSLVGLAASATGIEDPSKEHGVRVARLAGLVARELGLSVTLQRGVEAGCLVHDLGKVAVPSSILVKRTSLDNAERRLYDKHPVIGAELLERAKLPAQGIVQNVARFHHHAYDGGTTHFRVRGEAIPLEARIAAVCDEYDTLVTGRPRLPPINATEALCEIFEHRAQKFDPHVVDVFVEIVRGLQRTQPDVQAYLSEDAGNMEYFVMQRTLKKAMERALTVDKR